MSRKFPDVETRLLARLVADPVTLCWEWAGCANARGYGYIKRDGIQMYVHRVAYELWNGPIPAGLQIDHLCRNTKCCNPAHLEATTGRINTLRSEGLAAINARKEHCDNGHEFTPENTYIRPDGARSCRQCQRDSWGRQYSAHPDRFAQLKRESAQRAKESGGSKVYTHGNSGYGRGCRCQTCRSDRADYRRAKRLAGKAAS